MLYVRWLLTTIPWASVMCRSLALKLFHPESVMGREEPLISEYLTTALENSLTKIGGKSQISKTLIR